MPRIGDRIGAYALAELLGAGGFGSVWLAHAPDRDVAIKILHRDMLDMPSKDRGPSVVDRFLAEARIIARLDHPGLVQIYELIDDRQNGVVAYVMEKLEGCDLTKIDESLDLETLLDIFAEVADTLTFLHAEGVIHRDVTPRNIFVCDPEVGSARPCRVKILDFGTAKELYATQRIAQTGTGVLLGALRSMAPESFLPKTVPTPAIDQWGLGIAMYVVLTGRAPFDSISLAELVRQIEQDAPPPMTLMAHFGVTQVPPELSTIVSRLLAKGPEDRFPSIQEAAKALRRVALDLAAGRDMTVFDPLRVKTEPAATPSSMGLSPQAKLAQAMVSRRRIVALPTVQEPLPDGAEETIPAPPMAQAIAKQAEEVETDEKGWATVFPDQQRPGEQLNPAATLPAGPAAIAVASALKKELEPRTVSRVRETPGPREDRAQGTASLEPRTVSRARALETIDPIEGVTARLASPPIRMQSPARVAPRRKPTTAPPVIPAAPLEPTYVREPPAMGLVTTQVSVRAPELRPTVELLPEDATPREIEMPPEAVRAIVLGTPLAHPAPGLPPPLPLAKPWPSWVKSAALVLLMLAATAVGWYVRDLVARLGL